MRFLPVLLSLVFSAVVLAQDAAAPPASAETPPPEYQPISSEEVETLRVRIETTEGIDTAARDVAKAALDRAIASLDRAGAARERAESYRREADEAPAKLTQIRSELAAAPSTEDQPPAEGLPIGQLEAGLTRASGELSAARAEALELQNESSRRSTRQTEATSQIAEARRALLDIEQELKTPLPPEDVSIGSAARRLEKRARREQLMKEIDALEAELASYEARRELLPARRDRSLRRVQIAERSVSAWQEAVNRAREESARADRRAAEELRQRVKSQPALAAFADETRALTLERSGTAEAPGLISRITAASNADDAASAGLSELKAQYAAIELRERVHRESRVLGLSRSTGLLLRRHYEKLPDPDAIERSIRTTQQAIEDIEYDLIEWQDARLAVGDTASVVNQLVEQTNASDIAIDAEALRAVATELVNARREALDGLVADAERYRTLLYTLEETLAQYAVGATRYKQYVEERILWVRSVPSESSFLADGVPGTLRYLSRADQWAAAARAAWRGDDDGALVLPLAGLVWLSSLVASTFSRRRMATLNGYVARFRTDEYRHSLEATGLMLIRILPIPLLLWLAGWLLVRPPDQIPRGTALSEGLFAAAYTAYPLLFWSVAVRARGFAESHLRWPTTVTASVRPHLRWLVPLLVVCSGIVTGAAASGSEVVNHTLGRVAFTAGLAGVAFFLIGLVPGRKGAVHDYLARNRAGVIAKTRFLWGPLVVLFPIAMIVLAWLGWYYTVLQLEARAEGTFVLLVSLMLVYGLSMRWLFVARRRVAVEDAKRRREQASADAASATKNPAPPQGESAAQPLDEDKVDLPGLSAQSKQIFTTASFVAVVVGVYLIWATALPALRVFERVEVWPEVRIVEPSGPTSIAELEPDPAETANAASTDEPGQRDQPSSARLRSPRDIALDRFVATVLAFRNLPGLVEIVVLQRLPLDAGSRYALSTVLRTRSPSSESLSRSARQHRVVKRAVARGRAHLRPRLRPPGDLRQLHLGADHPRRAPDPHRRHRDRRQRHRQRHQDPHASDHDRRLGPQGTRHPQQDLHHGRCHQLDALRPDPPPHDPRRRVLRRGRPSGREDARAMSPTQHQGRAQMIHKPYVLFNVVRRQHARLRTPRLHPAHRSSHPPSGTDLHFAITKAFREIEKGHPSRSRSRQRES
jgi:potassium efflux system protein